MKNIDLLTKHINASKASAAASEPKPNDFDKLVDAVAEGVFKKLMEKTTTPPDEPEQTDDEIKEQTEGGGE